MVAWMRHRLAVKIEPVPVKTPSQFRTILKGIGAGDFLEADFRLAERGVDLPESFLAPEVGQAGVHAHPCPGSNDEAIRPGNQAACSANMIGESCAHTKAIAEKNKAAEYYTVGAATQFSLPARRFFAPVPRSACGV